METVGLGIKQCLSLFKLTGYTIGDRLLRPAMVTVARKEPGDAKA